LAAIDNLRSFDVENAEFTLWVFKKRSPKNSAPIFKGHWIETSDALEVELKALIENQRSHIGEVLDYGLLAQNNEASALTIPIDETHAGLVAAQAAAEVLQKKVSKIGELLNTEFYLIKLVVDDTIVYAVKKTDASWKTKKLRGWTQVVYSEDRLDLAPHPDFDIHKSIDFFIVGTEILIRHKGNFESVLNYREAHVADYAEMTIEAEFVATFSDLAALTEFVGTNKIQLRRLSVVRQKAHYRDVNFMERLRARAVEFGLNIQFDPEGRIIPSAETCRDIISALLDHRLSSAFSENIYDVPDTVAVAI